MGPVDFITPPAALARATGNVQPAGTVATYTNNVVVTGSIQPVGAVSAYSNNLIAAGVIQPVGTIEGWYTARLAVAGSVQPVGTVQGAAGTAGASQALSSLSAMSGHHRLLRALRRALCSPQGQSRRIPSPGYGNRFWASSPRGTVVAAVGALATAVGLVCPVGAGPWRQNVPVIGSWAGAACGYGCGGASSGPPLVRASVRTTIQP